MTVRKWHSQGCVAEISRSCSAAVHGEYTAPPKNGKLYTEEDWNETSTIDNQPYHRSKVNMAKKLIFRTGMLCHYGSLQPVQQPSCFQIVLFSQGSAIQSTKWLHQYSSTGFTANIPLHLLRHMYTISKLHISAPLVMMDIIVTSWPFTTTMVCRCWQSKKPGRLQGAAA